MHWKYYQARFFPKPTEDGQNPFHQWLKEHKESLSFNAFDPEYHKKILRYWNMDVELYHRELTKMNDDMNKLSTMDCFWCLNQAFIVCRQKVMKKPGDTTFQVLLTALEGNNHLAALIHAAFGSLFDSKEGTIQHCSITSDWFVRNLLAKVANDKDDLKLRLLGINFKKLIESKLSDEASMFN